MLNHGEKCTHCGGLLSETKQVLDGPRRGQTQRVCTKCGHIKYMGASAQPQAQAQIQQQAAAPPKEQERWHWSY